MKIVVVDIDGTIARVGDRLKHLQYDTPDWDAFYADSFDDDPINEIIDLVSDLYCAKYDIVFCTARSECVRDKTVCWLNKHFGTGIISYTRLLMRHDGDNRHDTIVKPELLLNSGITFNSIAFILEDRNSMVKKWRELGLTCLQVDDYEF